MADSAGDRRGRATGKDAGKTFPANCPALSTSPPIFLILQLNMESEDRQVSPAVDLINHKCYDYFCLVKVVSPALFLAREKARNEHSWRSEKSLPSLSIKISFARSA